MPGLRSRASRQMYFSTIRQAAPAIRIIRRFLRNRKLSPKEVELLNRAYGCALHSLHLVDRDDPIAEMAAKKIIEVGATVRDPEEVCKLAVEQLERPNQTGLTFRFLCLALADPSPIRLAAVRRCGSVDAGTSRSFQGTSAQSPNPITESCWTNTRDKSISEERRRPGRCP